MIKLNFLTCVQEALFPASFQIFFFSFFYNIQSRWEPFTDFSSSLFQIRNQTEGLESECWGSEVSAPTHLKGPNKVSNRNLYTSYFPLFTFTRNPVIPVAVHEYANSTSAHDTVLEHRFSPMQMPFTSWQYANERGQGWSCAVSSSRFHTINTACVHTQSCIPPTSLH